MSTVEKNMVIGEIVGRGSRKGSILDMETIEDTINRFATPFVRVDKKNNALAVKFHVNSDFGKFVNFFGLNVNTESGAVCLGYQSNSESYIPLFNLAEYLNKAFFNGDWTVTGEDVVYLLESTKIDPNFDLYGYLKSLDKSSSTYPYTAISLNYLSGEDNNSKKVNYFTINDSDDMYLNIYDDFGRVNTRVGELVRELLFNAILENEGIDEVAKDTNRSGMCRMYLDSINRRGVDPMFMRELSSYTIGMKKRANIYGWGKDWARTFGPKKVCGVLSSWSYTDYYTEDRLTNITDDKINTYNLMDLIRSINRDQDLYFSFDEGRDKSDGKGGTIVGNRAFFEALAKKLGLEAAFAGLGTNSGKQIENFIVMASLRDTGAAYSRTVKNNQKDFAVISSQSMVTVGRLFDKVSARVIKKF